MSRGTRSQAGDRDRRRRIAFIVGSTGFILLLVAVQVLTLSGAVALVGGWVLVVWGIGAALWAVRELWDTRAR
jgi:Flp pilus assembly protein TadB